LHCPLAARNPLKPLHPLHLHLLLHLLLHLRQLLPLLLLSLLPLLLPLLPPLLLPLLPPLLLLIKRSKAFVARTKKPAQAGFSFLEQFPLPR
jgi:4-hydroxybenzoate polyprenyltransferase